MNIETAIKDAAERSILRIILDGGWIAPDYSNRFKLPPEFLQSVWQSIDQDKLRSALCRRLEEELADRIVNHMAAEIATDVKQILSVKERREELRAMARQYITSCASGKGEGAA